MVLASLGFVLILSFDTLDAKPRPRDKDAASSGADAARAAGGGDQTAHFEFKQVNFHIDDTVVLQIDLLCGELLPGKAGVSPSFDDRASMILKIDAGEAAMSFAKLMITPAGHRPSGTCSQTRAPSG